MLSRAIRSAIGSIHRIGKEIKGKLGAGDGNLDLYQFGTDAANRESEEVEGKLAAQSVAAETEGGKERGAAAEERVEDEVAGIGRGEEDAFEQGDGLLRGMLAEALLPRLGRRNGPDGLHLLASGEGFHFFIVKGVAAFLVLGGPDEGFGGVGEIAAGKIGRRIGLDPGNVIEKFEAELLHGESDGVNDVGSAGNPNGAVIF